MAKVIGAVYPTLADSDEELRNSSDRRTKPPGYHPRALNRPKKNTGVDVHGRGPITFQNTIFRFSDFVVSDSLSHDCHLGSCRWKHFRNGQRPDRWSISRSIPGDHQHRHWNSVQGDVRFPGVVFVSKPGRRTL